MKLFIKECFVSILCLQLMLLPTQAATVDLCSEVTATCNYNSTDDADLIKAKNSCTDDGMCWDCATNRCRKTVDESAAEDEMGNEFGCQVTGSCSDEQTASCQSNCQVDHCGVTETGTANTADETSCTDYTGYQSCVDKCDQSCDDYAADACEDKSDQELSNCLAQKRNECMMDFADSQTSLEDEKECQEKATIQCASITDATLNSNCVRDKTDKCMDAKEGWKSFLLWGGQTIEGISIFMAVLNMVASKKLLGTDCVSAKMFNIAAIGYVGWELYYYFMLKDELDTLKENYTLNEDPYEAQLDAFNYLKAEQEAIKKISLQKAIVYTAISALYYATMVAASIEAIGGKTACVNAGASLPTSNSLIPFMAHNEFRYDTPAPLFDDQTDPITNIFLHQEWQRFINGEVSSSGLSDYQSYRENLSTIDAESNNLIVQGLKMASQIIPQAMAATPTPTIFEDENFAEQGWFMLIMGGAGAGLGALLGLFDGLYAFFTSPVLIAVIAAISGTYSLLLSVASYTEHFNSIKNIETLEDVIARFESSMEGYCSSHDDQSDSKCYCYNDDGSRNSNRGNSEICNTLWNPSWAQSKFVTAQDGTRSSSSNPSGCIAINGEFDQQCKCRRFKDATTGQNACYKTDRSVLNFNNLGTATGLNSIASRIDSVSQGTYSSGALGSWSSANNMAAKARKIAKKMYANASKETKNQMKGAAKQFSKLTKAAGKTIQQTADKVSSIMPQQVAATSLPEGEKASLLRNTINKNGLGDVLYSRKSKSNKKKNEMAFNFDFNESAAQNKKVVTDFMDKQYKIKNEDIVKKKDVSIWKVLSNRYNLSGLKRLFDE